MGGVTAIAIIGAGPYGLSLAAHLSAASMPYRIFGWPMDAWKNNMPPGMLLKSRLRSSNLYDPSSSFTLERFYSEAGTPIDDFTPPSLEAFIEYGEAFQARFVPDVERKQLAKLTRVREGFIATFDDGEVVVARNVVLAIGVHPFRYVPDILRDLPPRIMSHSGDHGPLDAFVGKEVAVLGSGSSATDLAALLNEKGASVTLIARAPALSFVGPAAQRSALRRHIKHMLTPLYPSSGIGSGWLLKVCADAPSLFHRLPENWRMHIALTALGPKGHDFMKNRVIGKVKLMTGCTVTSVTPNASDVCLDLAASDGEQKRLHVEHIIAATGYQINLDRLIFLDQELHSGIRTAKGGPILSANYESSVPGLHFIGPASLYSFGPVTRFVLGASHSSQILKSHFTKSSFHEELPLGPPLEVLQT